MRALLITPDAQTIEEVEVADLEDIKTLIGFDTLESDAVGTQGDRLYFDEECFLRRSSGRFQIDTLIPVAGKGVIVGATDDGTVLGDALTAKADLQARIKFQ
jgi:hypothetical protein